MSAAVSDNDVMMDEAKRNESFEKRSDDSNNICKKIFEAQGRLVEIDGPVRICGDLHGQFPDLIRLFAQGGFPPDSNYMFLGDYVDRGAYSLEVILLCLSFKARYPNNFMMLRGNHELAHINDKYGFREEIFTRKGEFAIPIYEEFTVRGTFGQTDRCTLGFQKMFDVMPLVGLIGGRILCMHGGISKQLKSLDDLRKLRSPFNLEDDCLENDILWSDPGKGSTGWQPNPRGASVVFGEDAVIECCKMLDIDLIVRGHQCVQDGYEFFAGKKLVTVFSAPHYLGTFTNNAAMCKVSAGLQVSFEVLIPEDLKVEERKMGPESTAAEMTQ
ncbi:hypothetical protein GCK72_010782 [Caenorhabditis remanei]|uniref:Serine/threonine-protein phosphatase n=1 Tax=Caenorhabditis remanei TaxID=31234 RepID=A0A6A5H3T6_CAERE|nr:hypothetical protein GCK72_010782 [Caenorhabditis remanei]KAF1762520.1 hypothetical protein GCK72_010782 [Caenorhabditis remanei]